LIAGGLTQVPLFNYVGYEFSAAMTIPAAFISGLLTVGFIRRHIHQPISRRMYLLVLTHYGIVNLILLLIPLVVMSANALVVKNCSFTRGLMYYGLLPVITMIFSISLAAAAGTLFRHAKLIVVFIILGILSHILVLTYTEPQLFAYNFVLGFFPGITYDETLSDVSTLLVYREFTLIASLFFVTIFFLSVRMLWPDYKFHENVQVFRIRRGDTLLYGAALLCLIVLAYGHFQQDVLGFQYSDTDIQRQLGGRAATTHFVVYYPPAKLTDGELQILKAEAEYNYSTVVSRLKESLHPGEKISVYLYPSGESKHRFIGTSTTNIAKPWRKEIHLTLDSFGDTFRHELVHVLAANIGLPVVRASARMALNEGLATAIDWNWGEFSPHEYSAALQREKLLGDPEELFAYTGFATQQSSYAYIVAGSFSRYLIDRFGVKSFKEVFPAAHFVESYGLPLYALIADWENFLRTVDASSLPPETIRTLFAQQSIFRKTCARVTAERNAKAVQAIRVKDYAEAENEFSASFDDAQTAFALRGMYRSLLAGKKYDRVVDSYNALNERSMLRYNPGILFLLADALWLQGDVLRSLELFRRIEEMKYSEAYTESAALRRVIVGEPRLNQQLRDYFYGSAPDSVRAAIVTRLLRSAESRVVGQYLQADEYYRTKQFVEAGEEYRAIVPAFSEGVLPYICAMNSARALYRAEKFEEAKSMFWQAQNFTQSPTMLKQIDEWIERCDAVAKQID
jgi:hypothetical protein